MTTTKLVAKEVFFLSANDEESFFNWLKNIDCVSSYKGEGTSMLITLKDEKVDDSSLQEIIALFTRYNVDLSQLSRLKNETNQHWFKDPKKYWYSRVFLNS